MLHKAAPLSRRFGVPTSRLFASRSLKRGRAGTSQPTPLVLRRNIISDNQPIRTHEGLAQSSRISNSTSTIKRILAIGIGAGLVVTVLTLPLADEITHREEVAAHPHILQISSFLSILTTTLILPTSLLLLCLPRNLWFCSRSSSPSMPPQSVMESGS